MPVHNRTIPLTNRICNQIPSNMVCRSTIIYASKADDSTDFELYLTVCWNCDFFWMRQSVLMRRNSDHHGILGLALLDGALQVL
jgi:hypothetical protein